MFYLKVINKISNISILLLKIHLVLVWAIYQCLFKKTIFFHNISFVEITLNES